MRLGVACDSGRAPTDVLELLEAAGLPTAALGGVAGPALVEAGGHTWLLACDGDVLAACERGVLDLAVAGKDALLELAPQVHELLDLRVARDALVFAVSSGARAAGRRRARLRVATCYPRTARHYFAAAGRQVELVELRAAGLATELGMAEAVVELESRLAGDAGAGLVVKERVASCSARLVAGRAARALRGAALAEVVERLRAVRRDA